MMAWMAYDDKTTKRFWSKVTKSDNGCWLWQGSLIVRNGYGQFSAKVGGRWTMLRAHRVAWELWHGPLPPGVCVLHKCDNPACVRPEPGHLFLGTQAENLEDMRKKGRASPPPWLGGTKHPLAKLTQAKAAQAQRWKASGVSYSEIARRLGVSRCAATKAADGVSYKRPTS